MSARAPTESSPRSVEPIYWDQPHTPLYFEGAPYQDARWDSDTGLRCWCGREVVPTVNDNEDNPSGWAHVGEP